MLVLIFEDVLRGVDTGGHSRSSGSSIFKSKSRCSNALVSCLFGSCQFECEGSLFDLTGHFLGPRSQVVDLL